MQVLNAAVYGISKKRGVKGATVTNPTQLNVDTELEALVTEILETYNTRLAHKTGVFQSNINSFPFSNLLTRFRSGKETFGKFTADAAEHLKVKVDSIIFAKGGYLFFAAYRAGGKDFLLVVKLNEAQGRVFDFGKKRVVSSTHLSTDKLQQAARINLTAFGLNDGNYVSLVSKRIGDDTSEYFLEFIGCAIAQSARQETSKLVAVIDDYCSNEGFTEEREAEMRAAVVSHIQARQKEDLPVSLETLAKVINPEHWESFLTFLNEHPEKPSDEFLATDRELRRLVKVYISVPGLRMTLTREFIDKHHARVVNGTLIIDDVPPRVIQAFE